MSPIPEKSYVNSLVEEIGACARDGLEKPVKRSLTSIYFGGGTPSLFSSDSIARIIETSMSAPSSTSDVEITLEVNPKTSDMQKLDALYITGVNRLSVGVQSFQDKFLQKLGRVHCSADIFSLINEARSVGFSNISLDLIFGILDQTLDDWERDLDSALSLRPQHLSVYNLTIEPNTIFYERQRQGSIVLPDEDVQVRMYLLAQEKLSEVGYEQYEISNFALPGFRCRHNEGYWTLQEYLGFGAGAHSYLKEGLPECRWGIRWQNIPNPYEYISLVTHNSSVAAEKEELTREEAIREAIFLGLRRMDGIDFDDFKTRFGLSLEETFQDVILHLLKEDLVSINGGRLRLTTQGILLSNVVFLNFF